MAEEKKDVDNIGKIFEGIKFAQVEDTFTVNVQFNSETELLSLKFINEKSKNVYKKDFDKEKIIGKCQFLEPNVVIRMIIDSLSSRDLTSKNMRIYFLPNIKQGICVISLLLIHFV